MFTFNDQRPPKETPTKQRRWETLEGLPSLYRMHKRQRYHRILFGSYFSNSSLGCYTGTSGSTYLSPPYAKYFLHDSLRG